MSVDNAHGVNGNVKRERERQTTPQSVDLAEEYSADEMDRLDRLVDLALRVARERRHRQEAA